MKRKANPALLHFGVASSEHNKHELSESAWSSAWETMDREPLCFTPGREEVEGAFGACESGVALRFPQQHPP